MMTESKTLHDVLFEKLNEKTSDKLTQSLTLSDLTVSTQSCDCGAPDAVWQGADKDDEMVAYGNSIYIKLCEIFNATRRFMFSDQDHIARVAKVLISLNKPQQA